MEGAQDAEAVLAPAAVELQLIRLRPGRMALRWALPGLLGLLVSGLLLAGRHLGHPALQAWGAIVGLAGGAGLLLVLRAAYPEAGLTVGGTLLVQPDALRWQLAGEPPRRVPLGPGSPPVTIWYTGYERETVGRSELSGYENFLAVGNGPRYRFWVPDEAVTAGLRAVLRAWYHRRVALKEYCQDSRTFLLERNLSYEQIQAYKQEFGVALYH